MKSLQISGSVRTTTGKTDSGNLRRNGMVPCVLYGGKENVHFSMDEKQFKQLVYTRDVYAVTLDISGKQYLTVMQDIQFHPVTEKILHVDFIEMFEDKPVTTNLPVYLTGASIGIKDGGILRFNRRKLKINGLPSDIPDDIKIDITELNIGNVIKVEDLEVAGITLLDSPNAVVVGVQKPRALIEEIEAAEAEAAELEVLEAMTEEEREEYEKQKEEEAAAAEAEGGEKPAEGEGKQAEGEKPAETKEGGKEKPDES